MGARVSIQFDDGDQKSAVLFSHWRGPEFAEEAKKFVQDMQERSHRSAMYPIDRLEAGTMLVEFIRRITVNMEIVDSDLYLPESIMEGDNGDYGHYVIQTRETDK